MFRGRAATGRWQVGASRVDVLEMRIFHRILNFSLDFCLFSFIVYIFTSFSRNSPHLITQPMSKLYPTFVQIMNIHTESFYRSLMVCVCMNSSTGPLKGSRLRESHLLSLQHLSVISGEICVRPTDKYQAGTYRARTGQAAGEDLLNS